MLIAFLLTFFQCILYKWNDRVDHSIVFRLLSVSFLCFVLEHLDSSVAFSCVWKLIDVFQILYYYFRNLNVMLDSNKQKNSYLKKTNFLAVFYGLKL